MSLFVDTSIWFSAADRKDRSHHAAAQIVQSGETLITTDHVVVEASRLIAHRIGRLQEEQFVERLLGGAAYIESVTVDDIEIAWRIGQEFPDQDFSLVDRTSFVVMQRLGVLRAATFDRHFAVYRFGHDRRKAFTVVR